MSYAGFNKATEAECPYVIASDLGGTGTNVNPWQILGLGDNRRFPLVISTSLNDHLVLPWGEVNDKFCVMVKTATDPTDPAVQNEFGCKIHVAANDYLEGVLNGIETIAGRQSVTFVYQWIPGSSGHGVYHVI
jgi:hypothetical protein